MGAGIYEKHDSRYARVMVKHRPAGIRVLLLWRVGGGGRGAQIDRHNWFNFCANFHGYIGKAGNLVEISSKYRSRPRQFLLFFFFPFFFYIVSTNSPFGFSVCFSFFIVIVLGLFRRRSMRESRVHYGNNWSNFWTKFDGRGNNGDRSKSKMFNIIYIWNLKIVWWNFDFYMCNTFEFGFRIRRSWKYLISHMKNQNRCI